MAQKRTPTTFSGLLVSDRRDSVSKTLKPQPSASEAAILEIQSDAGALLVSRLTTVALTALHDQGKAVNGMIAYDTDKKAFMAYQDGAWVAMIAADLMMMASNPSNPSPSLQKRLQEQGNLLAEMTKDNADRQVILDRLQQDQERQTKRLSRLIEQLNKQEMNQQKRVPLLEDDA
jgi:hypothetical protein